MNAASNRPPRTFRRAAKFGKPVIAPAAGPHAEAMTFGDSELDTLLNGGLTRELIKELAKADAAREKQKHCEPQLEAKPRAPLHLTFIEYSCRNCGKTHKAFGYLSRKITKNEGEASVTSYQTIADCERDETPDSINTISQPVPFCHNCMEAK